MAHLRCWWDSQMDIDLRERQEVRGWWAEVELVFGRHPWGLGVHCSEIMGREFGGGC